MSAVCPDGPFVDVLLNGARHGRMILDLGHLTMMPASFGGFWASGLTRTKIC